MAVRRDHDLEARNDRLHLGRQQVVPPDEDRRGAVLHRGRPADGRRDEVADRLQVREVLDAWLDVAERAAVRQRCGVDRGEGRAGCGRAVVEADHVLVGRILQAGERSRRHLDLGRVVADGHVAAVVRVPVAVGVLGVSRDVAPGRHLVRSPQMVVGALDGERRAHVDHVGRAALALELLHGGDLLPAGALGVGVGDLDAVLGGEVLHDRAVVGPVGRQRDDVELAFLLGGRDQSAHAAPRRGGGSGGPVGRAARTTTARTARTATTRTRGTAADGEQQAADDRGACRHGVPCAQNFPPKPQSPGRGPESRILARQVRMMASQGKREVASPWRAGVRSQSA